MTYEAFFTRATGLSSFPYQRDLVLVGCLPEALCALTGSGKTAAVVLAWLYRRRLAAEVQRRATPWRLVICLPMRTLVTQTLVAVCNWLRRSNSSMKVPVSIAVRTGPASLDPA